MLNQTQRRTAPATRLLLIAGCLALGVSTAISRHNPQGPGGDTILANEGVHVLADGTGRVAFPDSPGVFAQVFDAGATPDLGPLVALEAAVDMVGLTLDSRGAPTELVFKPTNGLPALLANGETRVRSIELNAAGEISGLTFATAGDENPGCVTVLTPRPDGTVKVGRDNVDCGGERDMLIVVNPTGGFSISCACREPVDPPQ